MGLHAGISPANHISSMMIAVEVKKLLLMGLSLRQLSSRACDNLRTLSSKLQGEHYV